MAHVYNSTIRDARMTAFVTEAGTSALIKLYDGTRPASGGAVDVGNTLIGELGCAATLGSVSAGVLTFGAITGDASANASGTPTFLRIVKSDGTTWVADFDTPSAPACTSGVAIDITAFTVTEGNG